MKRAKFLLCFVIILTIALFAAACGDNGGNGGNNNGPAYYTLICEIPDGGTFVYPEPVSREALNEALQLLPGTRYTYEDDEYVYEFTGWDIDLDNLPANGGEVLVRPQYNKTAKADMTFTVTWKIGDNTETTTVRYGETPVYPGTPTKDSTEQSEYTFACWMPTPQPVYGDAEYNASFRESPRYYDVVYYFKDVLLHSDKVAYGSTPRTYYPQLQRDNTHVYDITGWDKDTNEPITGDTVFNAVYTTEERLYTVTWRTDYWDYEYANYKYGETPVYNGTPTKNDIDGYRYTFKNWSPEITAVTSDGVIYTAEYDSERIPYTIKWKVDGEIVSTQTYYYGETPVYPFDEPTMEKPGYEVSFNTWVDEDGYYLRTVTGDATYTPYFNENRIEYTVKFYLDNDTSEYRKYYVKYYYYGDIPSYNNERGEPYVSSTAQYTYTFTGWDREITAVTESTEYYAQFKEELVMYNVTWLDTNGETIMVEQYAYGAKPEYKGDYIPTKESTVSKTYTFDHFGNYWGEIVESIFDNTKMYPSFKESVRMYTITWIIDGEESTTQVAYEGYPTHDLPTKDCEDEGYEYIFDGWYPDFSWVKSDATYSGSFIKYETAQYDNFYFNGGTISVKNKDAATLVIPTYYNGRKISVMNDFSESNATTLYIPTTITSMKNLPKNIQNVYFAGTEAQYAQIDISSFSIQSVFPSDVDSKLYVYNENSEYTLLTKVTQSFYRQRSNASPFTGCASITEVDVQYANELAFANCKNLTKVNVREGATEIGNRAFYNCSALTDVTLPDTLEAIHFEAFANCSELATLTLPTSLTTIYSNVFNGCTKLSLGSVVTIGANLTDLADNAFLGINGIEAFAVDENNTSYVAIDGVLFNIDCTEIVAFPSEKTGTYTLPASITTIPNNLVLPKITALVIPETITSYSIFGLTAPALKTIYWNTDADVELPYNHSAAFNALLDDLIIGDNVTHIPDYCFRYVSTKSVTFGKALRSVGYSAFAAVSGTETVLESVVINCENSLTIDKNVFEGCSKLTTIGGDCTKITSIGEFAFRNCTALTSFTFNDSITEINQYTFQNCYVLEISDLPAALTTIGSCAFSNCNKIAFDTLPAGVTEIYDSAFDHTLVAFSSLPAGITVIYPYSFSNTLVTFTTLPAGVTGIASNAFRYCLGITEMTIPASVIKIDSYAFYWCENLETINFAKNGQLDEIAEAAFGNCTALTSVTIPASVSVLGRQAFGWCYSSKVGRKLQFFKIADNTKITAFDLGVIFNSYPVKLYLGEGITNVFAKFSDVKDPSTKVQQIYLPSTLQFIGDDSLEYTKSAGDFNDRRLYYKGTEDEFKEVEGYYPYWNTSKVFYYSATTPDTTGKYWHYDSDGNMVVWWTI